MNKTFVCSSALILASSFACAQKQDDVQTRAMRDEMQRSMKDLKLESAEHPYFISYKIVDIDRIEAQASLGALMSSGETRTRVLTVSVRVGTYDLDNSNFTSPNLSAGELMGSLFGGATILPVDDNYEELRRKIWIATDSAYKKAVEDLSAKKASLQDKNRNETVPDFTQSTARHETETLPLVDFKLADAERLVRVTSAALRDLPAVESGETRFEAVNTTEHFLDSEGTTYLRQSPNLSFRANANLQTGTGESLADSVSEFGRSLSEFPSEDALTQETKVLAQQLTARRHGHAAKRYNGPVLFEGESAAVLFAHDFANLLSGHPRASTDSRSPLAALFGGGTASLLSKMGSRVLPDFLTVVDNPQLTQAEGHTLMGNYKFDEEGTPTQETTLVKDGILKALLTSRSPVRGNLRSTGSMRGRGILPGNLFVDASKSSTNSELKQQLVELIKTRGLEYGMIVRRLNGNVAVDASRVFPDGHEEIVRDARIAEVTANSFKDILAVSKERTVHTERAAVTSLLGFSPFSSDDLVTYVVPSMLFEDMTMEHTPNTAKPPTITSPLGSE